MESRPIVVATRGSELALRQTGLVVDLLRRAGASPQVSVVHTVGDRSSRAPTGEGMFVAELRSAVLAGSADLAVHSLKDLPVEPSPGLALAAVPLRADPRDCLVGSSLAALPPGARVATGSPRRAAQILSLRPDLLVVPIRGNVPTRIEKIAAGFAGAAVLAAAGLSRLGRLSEAAQIFSVAEFVPAPGQGALAIECRSADDELLSLCASIDDVTVRAACEAERLVLLGLGGGCLLPVAAYGLVEDGTLHVDARVVSADGARSVRASASGPASGTTAIAAQVVSSLVEQGARELL